MAIMRSMGASRGLLFKSIILEGSALTLVGACFGLTLGHLVFSLFIYSMDAGQKAGFSSGVFYREELWILMGSILLGIFCSLLPAIQAFRVNIHKVLAGN